eukprot:TRINITY_DN109021_c0_g1_i1.p1 TRINITY_DN109021_c0_g1~~TRINITY_DN109021_c0_g1_i1.p1  ORF type:complete len:201 (+),score=40.28 TRINITY_DN109021_c0_g1_i1:210-812(+)
MFNEWVAQLRRDHHDQPLNNCVHSYADAFREEYERICVEVETYNEKNAQLQRAFEVAKQAMEDAKAFDKKQRDAYQNAHESVKAYCREVVSAVGFSQDCPDTLDAWENAASAAYDRNTEHCRIWQIYEEYEPLCPEAVVKTEIKEKLDDNFVAASASIQQLFSLGRDFETVERQVQDTAHQWQQELRDCMSWEREQEARG